AVLVRGAVGVERAAAGPAPPVDTMRTAPRCRLDQVDRRARRILGQRSREIGHLDLAGLLEAPDDNGERRVAALVVMPECLAVDGEARHPPRGRAPPARGPS